MTEREIRVSPVLCQDCEAVIGEVNENDTATASVVAKRHQPKCKNRDVLLVRVGRMMLWWRRSVNA